MSRREKQYARLAALEADLRAALIRELEWCAASGSFFAFATRSSDELDRQPWFKMRRDLHLLELVEEIEKIQKGLGEPPVRICELYREFCAAIRDQDDEHRFGPKRLAQEFIKKLNADVTQGDRQA